jgi:hypothetical protein
MIDSQRKMPIGVFTGIFLVIGLAIYFWPKPACGMLTETLSNGFFMRWQAPVLLIVRSNKEQIIMNADSKELACEKVLIQINQANELN